MCKFYNQLKTIIDENSQEDKKLLLLAAMIDNMNNEFEKSQRQLQEKVEESLDGVRSQLSDVDNKLVALQKEVAEKISSMEKDMSKCPVAKSKQTSYVEFLILYPKLALVIILLLGYLVGTTGPEIIQKIIAWF